MLEEQKISFKNKNTLYATSELSHEQAILSAQHRHMIYDVNVHHG